MSAEQPFRIIYEGEWNDIACVDFPLTPEVYVRESMRPLENSHVDALFYNLCSSDAYCCGLGVQGDPVRSIRSAW